MTDTANANCRELLDTIIAHGVRNLVASPGSRNAPILIGASARGELKTDIINDERMAGFYALGIAVATRRPVALACTSGTALYNYAPAVAEAYYQKIPLIVISADRPSQWIDQDDSQTLHQFEALGKIVKKSFDIPPETGMTSPCRNKEYATEREWFVNRIANEAMLTAVSGQPGPVHINIQFAQPLDGTVEYAPRRVRVVELVRNDAGLPIEVSREIARYLLERKVMVVAGFMLPDNALNKALAEFARFPNVTVLCETLSNLHLDGHPHLIDSTLVRMTEEEKKRMRPDVIISIGGALVSRMLKEYLRECDGAEHWTLRDTPPSVDCFQRLTRHIEVSPTRFFRGVSGMTRQLLRKGSVASHPVFGKLWRFTRIKVYYKDKAYLNEADWSELKALGMLFGKMDKSYNLFLSNGTSVRYAQLLLDRIPHGCYSNRGVSGIDGTNATAAGLASAGKGTTLLVTGDMSFGYCTEILNPKYSAGDLRIVVINNAGGGIFRFIGTTRNLEQREEYFCSDPMLPLGKLAEAYGRPYRLVTNEREMREALEFIYGVPGSVTEIRVDPQRSAEILIDRLNPLTKK